MGSIPKNTTQPDTNNLLAKRAARPLNIRAAHTPLRLRLQLRRQLPQRKRHITRPHTPATLHLLRPANRPLTLRSRRIPGRNTRHHGTTRLVSASHTRHQIRIHRRRHRQRHTRQKPPPQRHRRPPSQPIPPPTIQRSAPHLTPSPERPPLTRHTPRITPNRN